MQFSCHRSQRGRFSLRIAEASARDGNRYRLDAPRPAGLWDMARSGVEYSNQVASAAQAHGTLVHVQSRNCRCPANVGSLNHPGSRTAIRRPLAESAARSAEPARCRRLMSGVITE